MNKKSYFEQLCELSYSCNMMSRGYMTGSDRRRNHLGK